jgi:hypothetical protein
MLSRSNKVISAQEARKEGFKSVVECEKELLQLGLTEKQIKELNVTLTKIAESVLDTYFDE